MIFGIVGRYCDWVIIGSGFVWFVGVVNILFVSVLLGVDVGIIIDFVFWRVGNLICFLLV